MKFEELVIAAFNGHIIYEKAGKALGYGAILWEDLSDASREVFTTRARSLIDTGKPPPEQVPLTAFDAVVLAGKAGVEE